MRSHRKVENRFSQVFKPRARR